MFLLPLGDESKSWIAMGNMFLKLPTRQSRTMLTQDQVQLDLTVNLLRSSLKVGCSRQSRGSKFEFGFLITNITKYKKLQIK